MTIPEAGEDPEWTETVPADWYEDVKIAGEVNEQVWEKYGSKAGVKSSGLTRSTNQIQGANKLQVTVEVEPAQYLDEQSDGVRLSSGVIPSQQDGIDIEVVEAKDVAATCYNRRAFDAVAGGVLVGGTRGSGTACCRVKKDGTFYLLMAAHLWPYCSELIHDYRAYQAGRDMGYVSRFVRPTNDYAPIKRDNSQGIHFVSKIDKYGGRVPAGNPVSREGAEYLLSFRTNKSYKVGITTGQTRGHLDEVGIKGGGPNCVELGEGYESMQDRPWVIQGVLYSS